MIRIVICLIFIVNFIFVSSADAAICRNDSGHEICILTIKRSAKYYWEYRVSISIDGVKTPVEIYNCRDKFKIKADKSIVTFSKDDSGNLICSLVK